MFFDLRDSWLVKIIFGGLAVLMASGLVLFGIGGDVSGGLLDAIRGGPVTDSTGEKQLERHEKTLETSPRNLKALEGVIVASYQLAGQQLDPNTQLFTDEGKKYLRKSHVAWQSYLKFGPKDPKKIPIRLFNYMTLVYGPQGLNRPKDYLKTAELLTERKPSSKNFYTLAHAAKQAKNDRIMKLASNEAIEKARPSERKEMREAIKQLELPFNLPPGAKITE